MIKTARKLAAGKIDSPRLEARMLIAHVLGIETSEVRFCRANLDSVQQKQLKKMLKERLSHKLRWAMPEFIALKTCWTWASARGASCSPFSLIVPN